MKTEVRLGIIILLISIVISAYMFFNWDKVKEENVLRGAVGKEKISDNANMDDDSEIGVTSELSIENLRNKKYSVSDLKIEQEITSGSNYRRYIASYISEGNKIFGLLTVPNTEKPKTGFPVIIFNHGYIPPLEYRTTERYVAYVDGFARNGYIVFKSDYSGHGDSEGTAAGGYGSNTYTYDVLNAFETLKRFKDSDPNRMGMWGHSMGGFITLRSMVARKDIKAGVIWAGVVASYPDLINNWRRRLPGTISPLPSGARAWRQNLVSEFGEPSNDYEFWRSISANFYLKDISGPLQIHHGTADTSVPVDFSRTLQKQMESADRISEYHEYPDDDHNISINFNTAIARSIDFFNNHLK